MEPSITFPSDKVIPLKEIITQKLNKWREALMERTVSYLEAYHRYEENPTAVVKVQDFQRYPSGMPIADIVDVRIPAVIEARANVAVLEKMLKTLTDPEGGEDKIAELIKDENIKNPKMGVRVDDPTFGTKKS